MGFFKDLKEDLSQAVGELLPGDDASQKGEAEEVTAQLPEEGAVIEPEAVAIPVEEPVSEDDNTDLEKMLQDALENNLPLYEDPAEFEAALAATEAGEPKAEDAAESAVEEALADTWARGAAAEEEERAAREAEEQAAMAAAEVEIKSSRGAERVMDTITERELADETSVITKGMSVKGDVSTEGSLDLIGQVNGNLDIKGKLNVTGVITGNSKAREIYAEAAKITGDVDSETSVKIGAGTVIIGNISATSAAIAGAVKGDIDVHGPVILDSTAIVMGNIRSKSVQINNGAAIEGMCSQCYADVSPTHFFDDYKPEVAAAKKGK